MPESATTFASGAFADASATDLVSFLIGGDGSYPVWLGRTASRPVACLVVVTALLPDLRVL